MNEPTSLEQQADRIFNGLNVIRLNDSIRELLSLNHEVLEAFIRKYSAVIIFVLSILDTERKRVLLGKMTNPALFYLIEEELRMLLLANITSAADDMDGFIALSGFLDSFVVAEKQEEQEQDQPLLPVNDNAPVVLKNLLQERNQSKLNHFEYLASMSSALQAELLGLLIISNINVALALLIYAPPQVANRLLDAIIDEYPPDILKVIPQPILNRRIDFGRFEKYARAQYLECMPADLQRKIKTIISVVAKQEDFLNELGRLRWGGASQAKEIRQQLIEKIFIRIKELSPNERRVVLTEIVNRDILTQPDSDLLLSAFQTL